MLDAIARNAKRIHMLTEDILDITRIETNTLKLNKEGFSLREVINSVVQDYQNELRKTDKHIELLSIYDAVVTEPHNNTNNLMIIADQNRIYQVLSNLLLSLLMRELLTSRQQHQRKVMVMISMLLSV